MLKLFHGVTSVCSIKVRIGLAEIGLDYEEQIIDLQNGHQFNPAYRKINPAAVIPTLIDDGLIIVESSLILEYLDRTYNESCLMPDGRAGGVAARQWLLRCLAIHAAVNTLTFSTVNRKKQLASKTEEQIEASIARMPDPIAQLKRKNLFANGLNSPYVSQALLHLRGTFSDMGRALSQNDWINGKDFGIADIAVLSYLDRLERLGFDGLWRNSEPRIVDWLAAIQQRPSYQSEVAAKIPTQFSVSLRTEGSSFWSELRDIWHAAA